MLLEQRITGPRGRISVARIWYARGDRHQPRQVDHLFTQQNQIQYDWGHVAARCIGQGDRSYRVNAIYIEFENVAVSTDPVTAPTYGRDEGQSYYQDLVLSSNRDFIRAPLLVEPGISIADGFDTYFTDGESGNRVTFHTQTQGSTGFHGKTFSAAANSKVFGAALVATPDFADPTQDQIFARTYFAAGDQVLKLASSQIGITWDISFE